MKRYDPEFFAGEFEGMTNTPDGVWVRYEDALACIAELEKERDALSEAFNRAHERELVLEKVIDGGYRARYGLPEEDR